MSINVILTSEDLLPKSKYVAKMSSYFCSLRLFSMSNLLYPIPVRISTIFKTSTITFYYVRQSVKFVLVYKISANTYPT